MFSQNKPKIYVQKWHFPTLIFQFKFTKLSSCIYFTGSHRKFAVLIVLQFQIFYQKGMEKIV